MVPKNLNLDVKLGDEFFADNVSVFNNPVRMVFDFKNTTPRADMRGPLQQMFVTRHNVIMMDPFKAKDFLKSLKENISVYEKKYGKIVVPKHLKKIKIMILTMQ